MVFEKLSLMIIWCDGEDVDVALEWVKVLQKLSSRVCSELLEELILPKPKKRKEQLPVSLPRTFNRQVFEMGSALDLKEKRGRATSQFL